MKASVVIPSLDGGERFVACATSLAKQKFHEPWEVVVIDSGSRDGSLEQFRQIIEEADIPFTLLEIHQTDFRHGPTRNQAIEASRGEIITLITQDAVPDDGASVRLVAVEKEPVTNVVVARPGEDVRAAQPVEVRRDLVVGE